MRHPPSSSMRLTRSLLPMALVLASSMFSPASLAADIQSEKWQLCFSAGPGCSLLKFWKLGDIGDLWVNVTPKDYDSDKGYIDLGVEFTNKTRCKVHIEGSFLRGSRAVATVEWGLLTLDPGEKISGHRMVDGLRDMNAMEGLHLSLMAIPTECEVR